jgi:hypothetical protein
VSPTHTEHFHRLIYCRQDWDWATTFRHTAKSTPHNTKFYSMPMACPFYICTQHCRGPPPLSYNAFCIYGSINTKPMAIHVWTTTTLQFQSNLCSKWRLSVWPAVFVLCNLLLPAVPCHNIRTSLLSQFTTTDCTRPNPHPLLCAIKHPHTTACSGVRHPHKHLQLNPTF